jgi:hypothetical protein
MCIILKKKLSAVKKQKDSFFFDCACSIVTLGSAYNEIYDNMTLSLKTESQKRFKHEIEPLPIDKIF